MPQTVDLLSNFLIGDGAEFHQYAKTGPPTPGRQAGGAGKGKGQPQITTDDANKRRPGG